jgi:hypothetical protein
MSRFSNWLAAMTISSIIITWGLSVSALAQSDSSESQRCPEGYALVGSECVNADGDVVKPQ